MSRSFVTSWTFKAKDSFSAISSKIKNGNKKLGNSFKKLNTDVKKSDKTFSATSKSFVRGFKQMAAAAIAFFGIREFVTLGAEFQDSMAELSAITGAAGADLAKLRKETMLMSKTAVTSQKDVAEAIKLVASAKPDLLENIDALTATTKQVLLLKNAAGIELAEAANITAQGLNIFGASADQASRFVNVLAAGSKLGSSEIAETGEAMLIAGPAARAAGLSFEQLNAAIQTVAKGGIKASRAGTALNAIFGRLQRAGIDFQKLGLQGSFQVIKDKMNSLTSSTARAQFAAKIFGEEHSKVGFAIMDNIENLGQYEKSLVGTNIAQEQADIRLGTLSKKWEKLGIVIKDVFLRVFLKVEPVISRAIDSLTGWFNTIEPGKIDAFGESLALLVQGFSMIGTVVGTVGGIVADVFGNGFKVIMSFLKGIGTLIGKIVGALVTLDFGGFGDLKELEESFSTGGKLFGVLETQTTGAPIGQGGASTTAIDMNIRAPEGVVESVQSRTKGPRNANVGVNMAEG